MPTTVFTSAYTRSQFHFAEAFNRTKTRNYFLTLKRTHTQTEHINIMGTNLSVKFHRFRFGWRWRGTDELNKFWFSNKKRKRFAYFIRNCAGETWKKKYQLIDVANIRNSEATEAKVTENGVFPKAKRVEARVGMQTCSISSACVFTISVPFLAQRSRSESYATTKILVFLYFIPSLDISTVRSLVCGCVHLQKPKPNAGFTIAFLLTLLMVPQRSRFHVFRVMLHPQYTLFSIRRLLENDGKRNERREW